jgi:hypothetical protein
MELMALQSRALRNRSKNKPAEVHTRKRPLGSRRTPIENNLLSRA